MRRTTWAILGWTTLWIIGLWAIDPASTVGLGGQLPPAWTLFDAWAIGFVLLGAAWNRVPALDQDGASSALDVGGRVRTVTRLVLGWTVLWIGLFALWAADPQPSAAAAYGATEQLKPPDWLLFDVWFSGFAVLAVIWLVTRLQGRRRSAELGQT